MFLTCNGGEGQQSAMFREPIEQLLFSVARESSCDSYVEQWVLKVILVLDVFVYW